MSNDDTFAQEAGQEADDALEAARSEIAGDRAADDEPPAGSARTSDGEDAQPPTDS